MARSCSQFAVKEFGNISESPVALLVSWRALRRAWHQSLVLFTN